MFLTETWCKPNKTVVVNELTSIQTIIDTSLSHNRSHQKCCKPTCDLSPRLLQFALNLPASQILRLQQVQNNAARLITLTSRHGHITPVLRGLRWLPVASRIHFKVLVLAYRCVNGLTPTYLAELLHICIYARTMRQHCTNASLRRALVNLHMEQQRLDFGIHCPQTFVIPRR